MTSLNRQLLFCAVCVLGAAGCSGEASQEVDGGMSFLATPLVTLTSQAGRLNVAVFTDPQPPVRGNLYVRYQVTNPQGQPVDGLSIQMTPWMATMGHGTSVTPVQTSEDGGVYDFSNVDLFMPGPWELLSTFTGTVSDSATPTLQVQ